MSLDRYDVYERQKMKLEYPDSLTVLGVGGVGSWVALNGALAGIGRINLFDGDVIEPSNLNRTPFCERDIGTNKTIAVRRLILERRAVEVSVNPLDEDECDIFDENSVCIDCRDTETPPLHHKPCLKLGYDGEKMTIIFAPDYSKIWDNGEDTPIRYTVTPSYLVPCQFLACFAISYIMHPPYILEHKTVTFTTQDVTEKIKEVGKWLDGTVD